MQGRFRAQALRFDIVVTCSGALAYALVKSLGVVRSAWIVVAVTTPHSHERPPDVWLLCRRGPPRALSANASVAQFCDHNSVPRVRPRRLVALLLSPVCLVDGEHKRCCVCAVCLLTRQMPCPQLMVYDYALLGVWMLGGLLEQVPNYEMKSANFSTLFNSTATMFQVSHRRPTGLCMPGCLTPAALPAADRGSLA